MTMRFGSPLLLHQSDQQAPGSLGVAASPDDLIEHVAVLIDGAPPLIVKRAEDRTPSTPSCHSTVGTNWRRF